MLGSRRRDTSKFRGLFGPVGWILPVVLFLSACAGPAERLWLKAPGWNRARLVATTPLVDPVSMALDDAGVVYIYLFDEDEGVHYPRVIALDRQTKAIWDRTYEVALIRPDQSRILWDGQVLRLFWLSEQRLYTAQVETARGESLGLPTLLSGDTEVRTYAVAADPNGLMTVWYAGSQESPGLYALPPGDPGGEAAQVDALGILPDLLYDDAGTLHATWTRYPPGQNSPQFLYGIYQDGLYVPGKETIILEPRVGTTRVYGPWLGLDRQRIYLLWTIIPRIGPTAGQAVTNYIHFPPGQPTLASSARQLLIPYTYRLTYRIPPQGGLNAGPRVLLESENGSSNSFISELAVNPAVAPEFAIAFHTKLEYLRRKEQGQVGTVFLQNGAPAGYQQLSFTPASSGYPAILSDQAGYLYLTWLESGAPSGYLVYFASTAPDVRKALSGLVWDDIGRLAGETIFGILGGMVLLPLALVWIIAPLIVVGLTSVIRRQEESLTNPGVIISLVLALAAYWVSKLALFPGIEDYVPFSAWLPFIPSTLSLPLRLLVPALITGLALVLAWRYTFDHDRPSVFFFLIIYAVIDGALTMAVYGPIFYGAF